MTTTISIIITITISKNDKTVDSRKFNSGVYLAQ